MVIITDRNDVDDQLFDTFAASKQLIRQEPVQAEDRNQLKELLKVDSGGVVFTTIQKFQPDNGNVYELLSNRENIVVIADEANRAQYGFEAKTIDDKNEKCGIVNRRYSAYSGGTTRIKCICNPDNYREIRKCFNIGN